MKSYSSRCRLAFSSLADLSRFKCSIWFSSSVMRNEIWLSRFMHGCNRCVRTLISSIKVTIFRRRTASA